MSLLLDAFGELFVGDPAAFKNSIGHIVVFIRLRRVRFVAAGSTENLLAARARLLLFRCGNLANQLPRP
ncbi:MAG: hypothetical protein AABN33_13800 [Acidobacteriota bacterium]